MAFWKENSPEVGALGDFISTPPVSKHQSPLEGLLKHLLLGPKVSALGGFSFSRAHAFAFLVSSQVILTQLFPGPHWGATALEYLQGRPATG